MKSNPHGRKCLQMMQPMLQNNIDRSSSSILKNQTAQSNNRQHISMLTSPKMYRWPNAHEKMFNNTNYCHIIHSDCTNLNFHQQFRRVLFSPLSSVQFSCSALSNSLWPHELQNARLPCPYNFGQKLTQKNWQTCTGSYYYNLTMEYKMNAQ